MSVRDRARFGDPALGRPGDHRNTLRRALARLRGDVAHETRVARLRVRHTRGRLGDGSGVYNRGRTCHVADVAGEEKQSMEFNLPGAGIPARLPLTPPVEPVKPQHAVPRLLPGAR